MKSISTIVLLFTMSFASAQVAIGFYGGIENSKFSRDTPQNIGYEFKRGYIAGLTTDFKIVDDVYLSARPNYNFSGRNIFVSAEQIDAPIQLPTDPLDTLFQYPIDNQLISFPLLAQVYVTKGFYGNAGLEYAYNFSSIANVQGDQIDIMNQVNQHAFSIIFGFGGAIPIGRTSINIELSYAQRLNTFTKIKDIEIGESPRLRTSRFRLVAYFIIYTAKER